MHTISFLLLPLSSPSYAAPPSSSWWSEARLTIKAERRSFHEHGEEFTVRSGGFDGTLDAHGLEASSGEDVVRLRLASWGREGFSDAVAPVTPLWGDCGTATLPDGTCQRRVELPGPGLTEYWQPTELGLEQAWEIEERLDGDELLVLELAIEVGIDWTVDPDGLGAELIGSDGGLWRYEGLEAWDAEGEPLSAWMEATALGLALIVDDTDAAYPITVDPTLVQADKLMAQEPGEGDKLGYSVAGAGDINGDGFDDILVGAIVGPGNQAGSGAVYVYTGSAEGVDTTVDVRIFSAEPGGAERFGHAVAGAGDINGDGYDDVVIGAVYYDTVTGVAYTYFGSANGLDVGSEQRFDGAAAGDRFGDWVDGAGDVDGDGYADVIIGATGREKAYVYYGSEEGIGDRTTLSPDRETDNGTSTRFGQAVAAAGDVDGDGYADVIVGSYGLNAAYVYYGGSRGISADDPDELVPSDVVFGDKFGHTASGAGDVNGDGYADVVVGSPADGDLGADSGSITVWLGSEDGIDMDSEHSILPSDGEEGWEFGEAVASAGDIDGDGYDDVIVGAAGHAVGALNSGSAYVYAGSRNGLDPTTENKLFGDGADAGDRVGEAVAGAGDVNGDGYADVLLGAWTDDIDGVTDAGSAYLFYGCPDDSCLDPDGAGTNSGGSSPWAGEDECGCASTGAGGVGGYALLALGALVVLRRRRLLGFGRVLG